MLRVSLLGEKAITGDGGAVLTSSSRALALVAFLVAHAGSPQPRPRIAGLFWPDSGEAQALTNLRRELHHLRRVLGSEPSLVVTSADLCWHDTVTCRVDARVFAAERDAALAAAASGDDAAAVAHAARAVAVYRGEFLPGVYDDWLLETRSELERQCVDVCDLLCATRARIGDLAGAVEAARRRIQLHPLEEAGYRTLMQLQADLGDRAGAVSTYHHCASVLDRDLGVSPGPATLRAFQRLMGAAGPAGAAGSGPGTAAARSGLATAALVGRAGELGRLAELWQAAAAGRPGLVLVRGGAGVGKTRLVSEVAELARLQGAVVASSQCFGTAGRLALAPVADWLRNPVVQAATATLEEAWRVEVGRLLPPAGTRASRGRASRAKADAWQRHRFFEGLARALLAVARPMLLILDNVQWCDQETLEFVTFCLRLAGGARLMIAATLRDDSPEDDGVLRAWADRVRAAGLLAEVWLGPFDSAGTARLAEAICGQPLDAADTDLLQATTGGFPLYVIEAVRSGIGSEPVPAGDLTAVLRKRLWQATAAAREVAGLASAVGTDFTLDLLAEASDLDADAVVAAVDELWRRRLVREFGDGYDFTHDLLRDCAYAQVSPPRRWLLHRRIAQGLELLHAGDTDPVAAQLAGQYARGGRPARAVSYYRRAADVAAGMFAHAEAIRLHEEALSVIGGLPAGRDRDRQELAVRESMAAPLNARYGYSSPGLQHTLERSIALAETLGDRQSALTGVVALWGSRFVQGRTADSYQIATRALGMAEEGSELSGPAHFAVGGAAVSLGKPAEGLAHFTLAAQVGSVVSLSIGTRPDVHGAAWAAHAHWLLGDDDSARSGCAAAIALARSIGHPYHLAVTLAYGAITCQLLADRPAVRDAVRELRVLCDRYDFAYYREWGLILDGWCRTDASGIGLAQRGVDNLRSEGSFARMPYWLSLLADLHARAGRPDAARATLDAALASGQARDDVWWLPEVMRMRAAYDQHQMGITRLRSAARMASAHGSIALLRRCERDLAQRGAGAAPAGVRPQG
jgi:DNA-binding SARP family transcriptional activator/tetratricopeptide (TPR) repeat protein